MATKALNYTAEEINQRLDLAANTVNGLEVGLNGPKNISFNADDSITLKKNGLTLCLCGKRYQIVGTNNLVLSNDTSKSNTFVYINKDALVENASVNWDEEDVISVSSVWDGTKILLCAWYQTIRTLQPIGLLAPWASYRAKEELYSMNVLYFSNAQTPKVTVNSWDYNSGSSNSITVVLPAQELRLINKDTGVVNYSLNISSFSAEARTFTINSYQKLVIDVKTNTLSVESLNTSTDNCVVLLSIAVASIEGLMASYVKEANSDNFLAYSFAGYFKGRGNTYASREIYGLTKNKTYRIYINKASIEHSSVTQTGVYGFSIYSKDGNGTSTNLVAIQTSAYDSIKDYYDIVIPADSVLIGIGGRANTGCNVYYSVIALDGLITIKEVYNTYDDTEFTYNRTITGSETSGFGVNIPVNIPVGQRIQLSYVATNDCITKIGGIELIDYNNTTIYSHPKELTSNNKLDMIAEAGVSIVRLWIGKSYMQSVAGIVTFTVKTTPVVTFPCDSITKYWNSLDKQAIKNQVKYQADFKFLYFSDIHGYSSRFERIIALANDWQSDADCIIDGGDDVNSYTSSQNLDWYDTITPNSDLPIIRAVGNHDAWTTDYGVWATDEQIYNLLTSKAVAQMTAKSANVVQPSDAATEFKNYYYVDFATVRVIVITSMTYSSNNKHYYDSTQDTWFRSVLADAITNNKAVICLNHGPMNPATSTPIESNWTSYRSWSSLGDTMHVDDTALTAVDDFIGNGGHFICWLTGHAHLDYLMKYVGSHGTQFCFTTSTAKGSNGEGYQSNNLFEADYDLFNYIGIDTTRGLIKVMRIGCNNNQALQTRNTFCWSYIQNKLISES